ncbi:MAG: Hpt domain-containing protein [Victivallaceae bacterium]
MKHEVIEYLKELFELSDEEVKEYMDDFFVSFDDCCDKLQAECGRLDFTNIRLVTHTLMGFCGNMGAVDVEDLARELNTAAKAFDRELCIQKIDEILQLHAAYKA